MDTNEDMTLRERVAGLLVRNLMWAGSFLLTSALVTNVVIPFMSEHQMLPDRPVTFQNQPVEDR